MRQEGILPITPSPPERLQLDLLRNKSGATRLGFAILLKFLLWHGRFPRALRELPDDAVRHLARQVRVPAGELAAFDLASRTAKRHRTEIRAYTASGNAASPTPTR